MPHFTESHFAESRFAESQFAENPCNLLIFLKRKCWWRQTKLTLTATLTLTNTVTVIFYVHFIDTHSRLYRINERNLKWKLWKEKLTRHSAKQDSAKRDSAKWEDTASPSVELTPFSLHQPLSGTSSSISYSTIPSPITSSSFDSPLCSCITPSHIHCQLKTYLFHRSYFP